MYFSPKRWYFTETQSRIMLIEMFQLPRNQEVELGLPRNQEVVTVHLQQTLPRNQEVELGLPRNQEVVTVHLQQTLRRNRPENLETQAGDHVTNWHTYRMCGQGWWKGKKNYSREKNPLLHPCYFSPAMFLFIFLQCFYSHFLALWCSQECPWGICQEWTHVPD